MRPSVPHRIPILHGPVALDQRIGLRDPEPGQQEIEVDHSFQQTLKLDHQVLIALRRRREVQLAFVSGSQMPCHAP